MMNSCLLKIFSFKIIPVNAKSNSYTIKPVSAAADHTITKINIDLEAGKYQVG